MSTSIDNRIVQMTFDNKQFEAAVKQSMKSLKDLDKSISDAGTGVGKKGFSNFIEELKGGLSISSITDALDSLKDRFTSWGIVGMTIIQNLTNSALDFAKRGISAINNALFGGGWQRAANLEQAQFRLNAMVGDAEEVAKIMKDVDKAVTGTAFGLDEAAVAASMFAATGMRSGKQMYNTLLGIAGMASTAGTSFEQISNIMIDAAATGVVTNDTLTRLAMQSIPAAIIMSEKLGITVEELKKKAQKGEITFAEFAEVMSDRYGSAAQKANETFSGALANMQTAFKRATEPFFTSFRTGARDVFNTLRDGINEFGSGLKTQLPNFTSFVETASSGLVNIIKNLTKANYITTELGKRIKRTSDFKKLGYIVVDAIKGVFNILNAVKKSFDDVFGGSASGRIKKFIDVIFRLEERFLAWSKRQTIVTNAFTLFFKVLKTAWTLIKTVSEKFKEFGSILTDLKILITPVVNGFMKMTESVLNFVEVFVKALNEFDLIGKVANLIHNATGVIKQLVDGLVDIVLGTISKFATTATESIDQLMDLLIDIGIFGLITWVTDFIKKISKATKDADKFIKTITESVNSLVKIPKKIVQVLNEVLKALKKWQQQLNALMLLEIAGAVLLMAYALKQISKLDGDQIGKSLGAVAGVLTILFGALAIYEKFISPRRVENMGRTLKEKLFDVFKKDELSEFGTAVLKFSVAIYILAKAIRTIGELDNGGAIRGVASIGLLMVMMLGIAYLLSTKKSLLKEERIRKGFGGLILMAISIKIIASALGQLAGIPWDNLDNALCAMTLILLEVVVFSRLMSRSSEGLKGGASAKSFIMLAISMKIIASALGSLASIDWDGLQNALAAMGMVLFEIGLFSAAMSKLGGVKGGAALIAMGAGIYIISMALANIAAIPWEALNNGMTILITLIITLTAVMLAAQFGGTGALAMMAMAVALGLLVIPLMALAAVPIENLASGLMMLVATLVVVGAAMAIFSAAFVPMLIGAAALAGASISILIFAAALMVLGAAFSTIGVGLTAIATGILAIYNVIRRIIKGIVDAIKSCVASIAEFFGYGKEEVDTAGEDLESASSNIGGNIANALKSALLKKIKGAFGSFKSGGLKMVMSLLSGFKSKVTSLPNLVGEGINRAKAKIAGFIGHFKTAGFNLVQGIAGGIRNGASHIFSAVGSIAQRALKKFKSLLGISSPSKVFAKASKWIPIGAAVGVKKASKVFTDSINDMVDDGLSNFSDVINSAFNTFGIDDDFNPVITPTLDLSSVKKDASQIGSMFGDNKLSASLASGIASSDMSSPLFRNMSDLASIMKKIEKNQNGNPGTNYFTFNVDGAENPEDFANRLVRRFAMEMRVG